MATVQKETGMALVDLPTGAKMVFEAINPTTGAAVGSVTVRNVTITVDEQTGGTEQDLPDLIPSYLPTPSGGNV